MPEFAVELRDVSKRFPAPSGEIVNAVRNVSLQIRDGEFFSTSPCSARPAAARPPACA